MIRPDLKPSKAFLLAIMAVGILGALLVAGCQSKMFSYEGQTVAEDRRIRLLGGGPHQGKWVATHLAVDYRYHRQDPKLQMSGKAHLKRYGNVDSFFLSVHFIDGQGKITSSETLVTTGGRKPKRSFDFEKQLTLPPDTASMVFSYSGSTRKVGEGSGSTNEFWQRP